MRVAVKRSGNWNLFTGNSPFFVENKKRSPNSRGSEEAMLSFTSGVILPSSGVVKSSGKSLEKLLKDHAGKYATGDEVSMADLFLAPHILAGIE
ncbi:hypothetical protein GOBAR_DD36431 [Gossypium barbadense]|nr:hypothetical protein GOBAR_DD36431 [Gossypium barbadense]